MSDVKKLHFKLCPSYQPVLDLSLDGIQESKSSSVSVDVFTVSFKGCRQVYPIRIIRPINKYKIDTQEQIKIIIQDIHESHCKINTAVGDNPKRSDFRCALCHSATVAYEYCEARAEYVTEKIKDISKKGHLAWPFSSTHGGPKRTRDKVIEIIEKIENNENISREEAKGFYGRSHFLDVEDFDFIQDLPAEYMHCGCLGVVKRMVELTYAVGENRTRNTKRKLSLVTIYNKLIVSVQSPREFNRRYRNLDFGVMKAQEFRNLI